MGVASGSWTTGVKFNKKLEFKLNPKLNTCTGWSKSLFYIKYPFLPEKVARIFFKSQNINNFTFEKPPSIVHLMFCAQLNIIYLICTV